MSSSTGYLKNLYVSQDLTLAEQIRLSGFVGGDKYRIIFPATQPTGGLSVLGVNSVSFDEITLEWLTPSESLPFDVINCNQLNAIGKEGVAITATDDVIVTNGDIKVSEGSIETEYLRIRSYQSTETTTIAVNPNQTEQSITYLLPPSRPTSNGQVLTGETAGFLNWTSIPPPVPQPASVLFPILDQTLNSATPTIEYTMTVSLQPNKTYQARAYGTMTKTNSGGTFNVFHSANSGSITSLRMTPPLALPGGQRFVPLNDNSPATGLDVGFIAQTLATGPFQVVLNLDSDISAAGVCEVTEIYVLFTEVFI